MKNTKEKIRRPPIHSHWLYHRWSEMHTRCYNKNRKDYKYYGGKGVRVCDKWHDFWAFALWFCKHLEKERNRKHIGPLNFEVDRRDSFGDYCPKNCRLLTHKENCLHARGLYK